MLGPCSLYLPNHSPQTNIQMNLPATTRLSNYRALESSLFSAVSSAATLNDLRSSHARLLRLGLENNNYLAAKLLRRLSNLDTSLSLISYSFHLFSSISRPNSFVWTALIRSASIGFNLHRNFQFHPLKLYSLMRRSSPSSPPISFTFSALLKHCSSAKSFLSGTQVHAQTVVIGGFDKDLYVQNTLVDFYVQCGGVDAARKVFDSMSERDIISWTSMIVAYTRNGDMNSARGLFDDSPVKDVVAWTTMINGYAQNGKPVEALEMFEEMRAVGLESDEVSLVGAISACASLGAVKHAKWIREIADRNSWTGNVVVGSALVDMYAKCGLVDEATLVFDEMRERNVYTYSAMIVGLAAHGRAYDAIDLFRDMVSETEVKPNHVTFIGVLTACSHVGLVEDGRRYFSSMKDEYGLEPSPDHYACLVDMLGRAGHIKEALEIALTMPMEPNAGVWGALLGACRIHGNTEIARVAAEHLFELEPDGIGNYVLLSNIYASAGMWGEVSKVRRLMRGKGLRKNPAASWVEGKDGVVHEFFAGDGTHPRTKEIKEALEKLLERLKNKGYEPILSSVVYDVNDDEKERLLKGHSEKLALAFGLLTTTENSTIRIVKNLRICQDCHAVFRLSTLVEKREIVVRDNLRFHHFKAGRCSCGDFW